MDSIKLLRFIEDEHKRLLERDTTSTKETETLARSVKLTEEVGELAEAVLLSLGHARQEKIDRFSKEDLEHEVADVLITTLLLARTLEVDIDKALREKIENIEARYR